MYGHDEDGDSTFEQFVKGMSEEEMPGIMVNLNIPNGETLIVRGTRVIPAIITMSGSAQHDPKRDAKMLAAFLSTNLDRETLMGLTEALYQEVIMPMMMAQIAQSQAAVKQAAPELPIEQARKKYETRKKKVEPEEPMDPPAEE